MFVVHWLLEYYSYDKIFLHLIVQTMERMYDFAETRIIIYFSKKKSWPQIQPHPLSTIDGIFLS